MLGYEEGKEVEAKRKNPTAKMGSEKSLQDSLHTNLAPIHEISLPYRFI